MRVSCYKYSSFWKLGLITPSNLWSCSKAKALHSEPMNISITDVAKIGLKACNTDTCSWILYLSVLLTSNLIRVFHGSNTLCLEQSFHDVKHN